MWNDPIVEEIRKAGEKLSDEAGGDVKVFFDNLRLKQEQYPERIASNIPLKPETVFHLKNRIAEAKNIS